MKKLLVFAVVAASFASCAGGEEKKVEGDTAAIAAPVDTAVAVVADTTAVVADTTAVKAK
jgi:hypothetical protein